MIASVDVTIENIRTGRNVIWGRLSKFSAYTRFLGIVEKIAMDHLRRKALVKG